MSFCIIYGHFFSQCLVSFYFISTPPHLSHMSHAVGNSQPWVAHNVLWSLSLSLSLTTGAVCFTPFYGKTTKPSHKHNIKINFFTCLYVILQIRLYDSLFENVFLRNITEPTQKVILLLIYCSFIAQEAWSPSVMTLFNVMSFYFALLCYFCIYY